MRKLNARRCNKIFGIKLCPKLEFQHGWHRRRRFRSIKFQIYFVHNLDILSKICTKIVCLILVRIVQKKSVFFKKHIQYSFTPQTSKRNRLLIGKPLDTLNLGPYIQCQRVFYGGWQHNYHCQQQARPMSSLFLFMSVSYHLRT